MPDWLIWLIIGGAFALAEVFTLTLVLIMFAGGAAAAAIVAAFSDNVAVQCLVAVAVSVALLGVVRPIARQHMFSGEPAVTGSDALVGMEAVALSAVDRHDGRVRLNGAEWTARAFDKEQVIPAGTVVRVMSISGATAVVWQEPKV